MQSSTIESSVVHVVNYHPPLPATYRCMRLDYVNGAATQRVGGKRGLRIPHWLNFIILWHCWHCCHGSLPRSCDAYDTCRLHSSWPITSVSMTLVHLLQEGHTGVMTSALFVLEKSEKCFGAHVCVVGWTLKDLDDNNLMLLCEVRYLKWSLYSAGAAACSNADFLRAAPQINQLLDNLHASRQHLQQLWHMRKVKAGTVLPAEALWARRGKNVWMDLTESWTLSSQLHSNWCQSSGSIWVTEWT